MKKIIFIFLLVVSAKAAEAQNSLNRTASLAKTDLLCFYRLDYMPDSTATTKRTEMMRLYCSKSTSKFVSNGTYLYDSLMATVTLPGATFNGNDLGNKIVQLYQSQPTNFKFTIFKDFAQNQVSHYERVFSTVYKYEEHLPLCAWRLTNNKAIIGGYACQKATTNFAGRAYEAWFTREIAVSDGPYKFCGLPGLVIKISDSQSQYAFELVKINQLHLVASDTSPVMKAKAASKQAIWRAREELKTNMPNLVAGNTNGMTTEEKDTMRARAKRDNNAIELR